VEHAELWAGERLIWSARVPRALPGRPLRFYATVRTRGRNAPALHAVAHGGSGLDALLGRSGVEPLAFTNPVYLARAPEAYAER
jgi:hypothetical protein